MPPLSAVAFLALAGLTLGSAGIVAFSKNIIHSTLALLGTFMGIAGLYITLSADFLAATQILVYVGGTLTLILFAVMLTSRIEDMKVANPTPWPSEAKSAVPSTAKLGHAFLGEYLLPFELGSVVLLGAMIGAVV